MLDYRIHDDGDRSSPARHHASMFRMNEM